MPSALVLARVARTDSTEIASYLSNAPTATATLKAAQVALASYFMEQGIEEARAETNLDESAVYHRRRQHPPIMLPMMAHAWLASICCRQEETAEHPRLSRLTVPRGSRLLEIVLPLLPSWIEVLVA